MSPEMKKLIQSRQTKILQSLLSRMSCKLRSEERFYEYTQSPHIAIYLEPVDRSGISRLPIEINFPDDTSSSSYRSLIKLTQGDGFEYLGNFFYYKSFVTLKIIWIFQVFQEVFKNFVFKN